MNEHLQYEILGPNDKLKSGDLMELYTGMLVEVYSHWIGKKVKDASIIIEFRRPRQWPRFLRHMVTGKLKQIPLQSKSLMKNSIKSQLIALIFLCAFPAAAQLAPPIAQTNIVRLTPATQLQWLPNPPSQSIHGYQVIARQAANSWTNYTAGTNTPLSLFPGITAGLLEITEGK